MRLINKPLLTAILTHVKVEYKDGIWPSEKDRLVADSLGSYSSLVIIILYSHMCVENNKRKHTVASTVLVVESVSMAMAVGVIDT